MTSYTQTVSRRLPRGWLHFLAQIAFWLGFYVVYQMARGFAPDDPEAAVELAEIDGLLGAWPEAIRFCDDALRVDPGHPAALDA